ncbi:hypothetical protein EG328_006487 [Venturia inaequalis]|uniref:Uncharacterized protein n=1 Tax=Venturia inaequalis TaxID=5025 RepID=A0A8H3YSA3_VENIN|nr:hypothetical protein EG328_006487 [Venturia inaequalis]RDI82001.1 hypothetical protein Vi05172_g8089 [Venturia inaequalis]
MAAYLKKPNMYLQSSLFLPAILFAQSSFAYNCCFEMELTGRHTIAQIIGSGDGNIEFWQPKTDCVIYIEKRGGSCATWKQHIVPGYCQALAPWGHIGVTDAKKC